MTKVIRRWLLTALPVVMVVSMLTFVLTSFIPGDAARAILGLQASEDQVQALRDQMGLDKPLPQQYWDWLVGVFHGDLGRSIQTRGLVASELEHRAEVTLSLLVLGVFIVAVVGIALGVISAVRGGRIGKIVDVLSLAGIAVPGFWLGLVLVTLFAVKVPLFPATGYISFTRSGPGWIASLALPLLTLALTGTAILAKQTRSNVLDELNKDYVRMLRARGVSGRRILLLHVLRNAAGPVVTIIGLTFIGLIGGAVLLETVFVLPGVGMLMVQATKAHDIPVIQGVTLMVSLVVVAVNLLVEVSYALLDPRVRT